MKKKNGFTLVELLAVIVILAIVGCIGAVATISIKEKMNQKMFNEQLKEIISAAETYGSDNKELFDELALDGTNYDNDLEKTVMRISVQELIATGYEKIDGDPKQILDPNTGVNMDDLTITVYETNSSREESGRVNACIKNIVEDSAISDPSAIDQYSLLNDTDKTKYAEVYCFSGDTINDLLKDNPTIGVKILANGVTVESNDWTNVNKEISYTIRDKSSNLEKYAAFENTSGNPCNAACSMEGITWNNITGDAKKEFKGTLVHSTIEESKYCICTKDSNGNEASKEVSVSNVDTATPEITKVEATIDGATNKITSLVEESSRNLEAGRYENIMYAYKGDDDAFITDVSGSEIKNVVFANACSNVPEIKASLTSKAGNTSPEKNVTIILTNCAKITFNANGGSFPSGGTTKEETISNTYTINMESPTKTGYAFKGWNENQSAANAGTVQYSNGSVLTGVTSSKTLYAVWQNNSYSLTYINNLDGATGGPGTKVQTGSNQFTVPNTNPTRSNATFLGWSTSSTATTATWTPGQTITITSGNSMTVYGVWKTYTWKIYNSVYTPYDTGNRWDWRYNNTFFFVGTSYKNNNNGTVNINNYKKIEWTLFYTNQGDARGKWFCNGGMYGKADCKEFFYIHSAVYWLPTFTVNINTWKVKKDKGTDTGSTVTSKFSNAYPENGESGGKYYVRQ